MNDAYKGPVLDIEGLNIAYYTRAGALPAVIDFNLKVHAGESVGLVGESGCGKSTVANAIMNYMGHNGAITGGTVKFNGRDMGKLHGEELRKIRGSEIAMIYQEPMAALNPSLRIGTQLMEVPLTHENVSKDEARARARQALADVHLPDPDRVLRAYPHQISGGQQQRVVIAMALMSKPTLLILDEPTTALDVTVEAGIVRLIQELGDKYGMARLFISHNLGLIRQVCTRVAVMYSGETVEEGEIAALFAKPQHPYTQGLFNCIPVPDSNKGGRPLKPIRGTLPLPHERPRGCNFGPRCDFFKEGLCDVQDIPIESLADRKIRCVRWNDIDIGQMIPTDTQETADVGDYVIEVVEMSKHYRLGGGGLFGGGEARSIKANEALNFRAKKGETLAIVGESGCGKSTFAKVLMGLETATAGEIKINGTDISRLPVRQRSPALLATLQMVFQNPSDTLNPSHSIGAQIGRVIRKFGVAKGADDVRERVLKLLDAVKLPREFYYRKPRQLSGGQKQRIGIARAFAGNPAVVVADEPVSALDVSVAAAVIELLTEIQREFETVMLFISHDLSVVRYLSDRVVVMYLGKIMEVGLTEDIFSPPYHPYTEALLSAVPIADPRVEKREIVLEGNLPSPLNPPKGCPFATRCPRKLGEICDTTPPPEHITGERHRIACHIPLEDLMKIEPVIKLKSEPVAAAVGPI